MLSIASSLTILLLGLRHGFDLDHIAAISDIVSQTQSQKKALLNGFFYIFGHAVVVIFLGLLAIALGVSLPSWVDQIMGPVVGATLILLGFWIILNILVKKKEFKFVSRWMLFFKGFIHIYNHLFGDKHHHPIEYPQSFGIRSSYILGTVHGIGAETPTQVLLLVTAAGIGGFRGGLLLLAFVVGLLMSNSLVLLLSILGFIHAKRFSKIYPALGILAGVVSLLVGFIFLTNGII